MWQHIFGQQLKARVGVPERETNVMRDGSIYFSLTRCPLEIRTKNNSLIRNDVYQCVRMYGWMCGCAFMFAQFHNKSCSNFLANKLYILGACMCEFAKILLTPSQYNGTIHSMARLARIECRVDLQRIVRSIGYEWRCLLSAYCCKLCVHFTVMLYPTTQYA